MSKTFKLGGASFFQTTGAPSERGVSSTGKFVLVKTDEMLAFYKSLTQFKPRNIMEIGMYEGGSLVWYDKVYKPDRLVGVDARREPIAALEEYRADNPHVITYYGRYQQMPGTLTAARQNFPNGIDLVVDDASHLYEETKATFQMLFPLVTSGGHYIIEDWTWSHRPAYQGADGVWADKPALTNLVFELIVAAAMYPVIESIHVDRGLIAIKKGKGVMTEAMMDPSNILRGKELPLL